MLSFLSVNALFSQSNNGTNISGDDFGWGDGFDLIYKVDNQTYKIITYAEGASINPEPSPTKEGYTFSGWSEIPATMPANDIEITGTFSINSYSMVYKVDGETYKSTTVEYGTELTAEPAPAKEGYTFSGWSGLPQTMPANDVIVTGTFEELDVICGDVNEDGTVDISDYIGVANYILGHIPDIFNETAADINNDGSIDISDYIGVANIILTGKP